MVQTRRAGGRAARHITDRGVAWLARAGDRLNRDRQVWSVRTAVVGDVREVAQLSLTPWELGRLDRSDVTDVDAGFVADPFVIRWGDGWWLFVEVWDRSVGRGVIGAASSTDATSWKWQGIVLREPFHLSYPQVFVRDDRLWMVPETGEAGGVRLYAAGVTPTQWHYTGDLITWRMPIDPTLFEHGGRWWCFVETNQPHNDTLRLFSAEQPVPGDTWVEHPASPIVAGDAVTARPAGPPVLIDGSWYRLSQSCRPRYGVAVRAHRIDQLDRNTYREDRVGFVLLHPGGREWNRGGSHHLTAAPGPTDGSVLVAFDGY